MALELIPAHNFAQLDEIIEKHHIIARSLNPQKTQCTSFRSIGDAVAQACVDKNITNLIKETLELILIAEIKHFPENIFWDFDYIVNQLVQQVIKSDFDASTNLEKIAKKIVSLMDLFGNNNEICFRYVHDFSYGFDWARWVQKNPEKRSQIRAFDDIFLDNLLERGQNMIAAIANDKSNKYRQCHNHYRNSFNFSREPEDEYRLMTLLASYQLIPVPTWDWNAAPIWNKPFDKLREQVSKKIAPGE